MENTFLRFIATRTYSHSLDPERKFGELLPADQIDGVIDTAKFATKRVRVPQVIWPRLEKCFTIGAMNPSLIIQALILVATANCAPIVAKKILGNQLARPIDGGACFLDGRPWLGPTKTIRGIAASIAATVAIAPVIGVDWAFGLLVAVAAMAGDLCSSFAKRRFAYAPSSKALGVDHIPESLLPLLVLRSALGLSAIDILIATVAFWIGTVASYKALYRMGLRDRPH